ncbi:MAG: zf-TFIIB domain-containing protein [Micromonosporaceae bacterium]|nr:zf-TFIIB domain-containing protein [Micromonosporaceae bacterium]
MQCPKCHGAMRTYDRHGIHIEQCDSCRGIFLDYGELEALTRMETQHMAPPPGYGATPAWGAHHGHGHHGRRGFGHMLFSS